jgi:hypothetical protein
MPSVSIAYTIVIIIVIIITIILVLFISSRYNAISGGETIFTYGDRVIIESLANGNLVTPSCDFGSTGVSYVSASTPEPLSPDLARWEILIPPPGGESNGGYVFKNVATNRFLYLPRLCIRPSTGQNFSNGNIWAVAPGAFTNTPTPEIILCGPRAGTRSANLGAGLNPPTSPQDIAATAYNDSRLVFKIIRPRDNVISAGERNVFYIINSDPAGIESLIYAAGDFSQIGSSQQCTISNTSPCSSGERVCLRYTSYNPNGIPTPGSAQQTGFGSSQQALFRITRI